MKTLLAAVCLTASLSAMAATYSVACSGTITTPLQNAITAAVDGDTVSISAGTCSAGTVRWQGPATAIRMSPQAVTT